MIDADEDFASMFEASTSHPRKEPPKVGQAVQGPIVALDDTTAFIDLGTRAEGRLDKDELLAAYPDAAVGTLIRATIVAFEGRDVAVLSTGIGRRGSLDVRDLTAAAKARTPIEGEFTAVIKGGLEVELGGRRAFCPASQVDLQFTQDLEPFVGERHRFVILEVRDHGRSLVVSRKAALELERVEAARQTVSTLQEGADVDGTVQSIQPYGVFVDIGGLMGMIHVSELAHGRVTHPQDLVKAGERVRVRVLGIEGDRSDPSKLRVRLSMKALVQAEPGSEASPTGPTIVASKVTKVEGHAIWVETPSGRGRIALAELPIAPGSDPRRTFAVGDELKVAILGTDPHGNLRLSAKAVSEVEAAREFQQFRAANRSSKALGSLGDLLRTKIPSKS